MTLGKFLCRGNSTTSPSPPPNFPSLAGPATVVCLFVFLSSLGDPPECDAFGDESRSQPSALANAVVQSPATLFPAKKAVAM